MDAKKQSSPFLFWDGDENPTQLIQNILPLMSRFSNVPEAELKEMISTAVMTALKGKYTDFEFTTEFDENGVFHLKHDYYDFLPALSSGDRIVLWVSLLAAISKSAAINLRFILNRPFYRLDAVHSNQLAEFMKQRTGSSLFQFNVTKQNYKSKSSLL